MKLHPQDWLLADCMGSNIHGVYLCSYGTTIQEIGSNDLIGTYILKVLVIDGY